MAKMVKCLACGESFDRDTIEAVKEGRRYMHKTCEQAYRKEQRENMTEQDIKALESKYRKELIDYTMELSGDSRPQGLALKQMKEFREMGYSYQGMKSTLYYFHEILGNPVVGKGIGIVPHVYNDAIKWYTMKRDSEKAYKELVNSGVPIITSRTQKVPITSRKKKKPTINIEDI